MQTSSLLEIQCMSWLPISLSGPLFSRKLRTSVVKMSMPKGLSVDFSMVEEWKVWNNKRRKVGEVEPE